MDASNILRNERIVPVVVIDDADVAISLAEVLFEAGFGAIEITLRTSSSLQAIENIAAAFPDKYVGAGSVRKTRQFAQIKDAGARFAVSPGSSQLLLDAAAEYKLPFVPGAVTASETIHLQERGYTLIKFFPAELAGGTRMLRALGGPLPEARFFPTGGITPALAKDYLALPNVACIGGSWLTPANLLAAKDLKSIARLAHDAVESLT